MSSKVCGAVNSNHSNGGTALAFMALIGMPATFAGFGFVVGLIEALLYNLFARWSGGMEIDYGQQT